MMERRTSSIVWDDPGQTIANLSAPGAHIAHLGKTVCGAKNCEATLPIFLHPRGMEVSFCRHILTRKSGVVNERRERKYGHGMSAS